MFNYSPDITSRNPVFRTAQSRIILLSIWCLCGFLLLPITQAQPFDTPDWPMEAIWYQICVDRFHNGDSENDPNRESLSQPDKIPESWTLSSRRDDWYSRSHWEAVMGSDFFPTGLLARRYGGDLQGILDRLDYLQLLGVNAIHLGGIFWSPSYDRNVVIGWHHVDPFLGPDPAGDISLVTDETEDPATWKWTKADLLFLELIKKVHDRGMHILLDVTWNQVDSRFFLRTRQKSQKSESSNLYSRILLQESSSNTYDDWFELQTENQDLSSNQKSRALPLALLSDGSDMHPDPKLYIFHSTRRWMDPDGDGLTYDGIDGWHTRDAETLPQKFLMDWNSVVRLINMQSLTLCSVKQRSAQFVASGKYSTAQNQEGFGIPIKGFLVDGTIGPQQFMQIIKIHRRPFPPQVYHQMQNTIESLDSSRLISIIAEASGAQELFYDRPSEFDFYRDNSPASIKKFWYQSFDPPNERDRRIQKMALILQMTFAGAPVILYGSELGLWGGGFVHNNKPVRWADNPETQNPNEADFSSPNVPDSGRELFQFYQKAIYLRQAVEAFQKGNMQPLIVDDERMTLVYARYLENRPYIVALNRAEEAVTVSFSMRGISLSMLNNYKLLLVTDNRGESKVAHSVKEGSITIRIPALTGLVLGPDPAR